MKISQIIKSLLASLLLIILQISMAQAGLIRDAEIEHTLKVLAEPIFTAAGLDPTAVRIFIVQDPEINAFVAGGSNVFLHTGLLMACDTPEMLAGVIAHETGHIAGGHLARGAEQLERASMGAILSYVLGAAATAAGAGDIGSAVISAGSQTAQRGLLSFSRANENAADQAAMTFLDKITVSAEGMVDLFNLLERNEREHFGKPDPYTLTHPLSGERIDNVRHHVADSPYKNKKLGDETQRMHRRMIAKLLGFLLPEQAKQRYPVSDTSVETHYARAIAEFRQSDMEAAIAEMDALLKSRPDDPYFLDTKGQILYESGRVKEAEAVYGKAVALVPDAPLIRTAYAESLIAQSRPELDEKAVAELERSSVMDPTHGLTWRLLATAHGRLGHIGMSQLALAEEASLNNKLKEAKSLAAKAMESLPKDSPSYRRAQDLKEMVEREIKDEKTSILPFSR